MTPERFKRDCRQADFLAAQKSVAVTFPAWLRANVEIWRGFVELADKMRARRSQWSAEGVINVLRWHTAINDTAQPVFKINNNLKPALARLYNHVSCSDFFTERQTGSGKPPGDPGIV